jgi:opacity protein-like surface antigen
LNKLLLTASLLAIVLAAPAFAADLQIDEAELAPLPDPVTDDWTGFYAGVFGGYVSGAAETVVGVVPDDILISGGLIGAAVGFNVSDVPITPLPWGSTGVVL